MFLSSVDFGLIIFTVGLGAFIFLSPNVLNFILLCEVVWISLYFYGVAVGAVGDSLLVFIWGVMLLCLATGESVIGLSLLLFKFAVEGSVRKFYGLGEEQRGKRGGYSRFWNRIK